MIVLTSQDVGGYGEQVGAGDHVSNGDHVGDDVHEAERHIADGEHVITEDQAGNDDHVGSAGHAGGDELLGSEDQDACEDVDVGEHNGAGDFVSSDQHTDYKLGIVERAVGAAAGVLLPLSYAQQVSDRNVQYNGDVLTVDHVLRTTLDGEVLTLAKGDSYMRLGRVRMPLILPIKCGVATGHLLVPLLLLGRSNGVKLTRDKTTYYRCILHGNKNVRFSVFLEASGIPAHWKHAHSLVQVDTNLLPCEVLEDNGVERGMDISLDEWQNCFAVNMRQLSQQFATWHATCPWLKAMCDGMLKGKVPSSWPASSQVWRKPMGHSRPSIGNPLGQVAHAAAEHKQMAVRIPGKPTDGDHGTGKVRKDFEREAERRVTHGAEEDDGCALLAPQMVGAKRPREDGASGALQLGTGEARTWPRRKLGRSGSMTASLRQAVEQEFVSQVQPRLEKQVREHMEGQVNSFVRKQVEQLLPAEIEKRLGNQPDCSQWRPPQPVEQQVLQWLQQLQQEVESHAEQKVAELQKAVELKLESYVEQLVGTMTRKMQQQIQEVQQQGRVLQMQLDAAQQTWKDMSGSQPQLQDGQEQGQASSQQPTQELQQSALKLCSQLMAFVQKASLEPREPHP